MKKQQPDNKLEHELAKASKEVVPERDLWPGIEHSLNRKHSGRRNQSWMIAASVLIGSLLIAYPLSQQNNNTGVMPALALLQSEHQDNKQKLLVGYQGRSPVYVDWQTEMQQMEEAEALIYQALKADPADLTLLPLLRQMQSKQLELIDKIYAPRLTEI